MNLDLIAEALAGRSATKGLRSLLEWIFAPRPEPTPEQKRLHDIRSGVLTISVGIGLSLLLFLLLNAVAQHPHVDPAAARIIRAVWTCGLIPIFVGIGQIVNGLFFWRPLGRSEPRAHELLPPSVTMPLPSEMPESPTRLLDDIRAHRHDPR
ncbi:MAG: hypothetical protein N0A16_01020 [Blastocatellia bacterium]|nr:hypothetical protein [Blastocatellia bacterium]MCS7156294.1 hypothetical protein [Blastocatellia bacterium]MCX7751356.1 hypothetical protein [Blastocatellia bacterium]MDW8169068.1 hypothetical protein [Acidobacteriota bacterium]MDW8256428.1 hypothetical protein [Acidobacteriota bacterium]